MLLVFRMTEAIDAQNTGRVGSALTATVQNFNVFQPLHFQGEQSFSTKNPN